jgi:hypothetical protein
MKLSGTDQKIVNDNMRTLALSPKSGSHVNCFKYHPQNTEEHERLKFEIFKELRDQNIPVMVEAIFVNGCRADIFDLLNGEIIEVLHTESPQEAKEKVLSYPSILTYRFARTEANKAKFPSHQSGGNIQGTHPNISEESLNV